MKVDVVDIKGKKVRTMELPASVFEAPVYVDLMHQAYVRQMANARLGTHSTKTRQEVAGGGRKPWRQKGTGRARQGSTRAAQWVGGGKVHTPKPRGYEKAMPKKMRRAALRSALTVKARESQIVVVDDLKLAEPKTKLILEALVALIGDAFETALILLPDILDDEIEQYEGVMRAVNNLPEAKTLHTRYLNIRDLLKYDHIVMPVKSVEIIDEWLGEEHVAVGGVS